jgi:ribosome-binding factor A
MLTQRQERLNKLLREEISELLLRHLKDPRLGMITVSEVRVLPDLSQATVFVSVQGDDDARQASLAGLESAAGHIRTELSRRLRLRRAPELRFILDEMQERGDHILDLIDQVSRELHEKE